MKRILTAAVLTLCALTAKAQTEEPETPRLTEAGRIFRTEVIPHDTRRDADARNREAGGYYMAFTPKRLAGAEGMSIVGLTLEIPYAWSDGNVYLHLENVGSAYSLWINDRAGAEGGDGTLTDEQIAAGLRR